MFRNILLLLCLLIGTVTQAQEYRISVEGFVMPDLNSPVTVFAEANTGSGYKELPTRKYQIQSIDGIPAGSNRNGYSFQLNRDQVYRNNGKARFDLITEGRKIPVSLSIPILQDIKFNLYTDSIKPILNYYVNVEGVFSNEQILPIDTSLISLSSDQGMMKGMDWIAPKERSFEKVTFTATGRYNPRLTKSVTLYLQKYVDPRDALDYEDKNEENIKNDRRRSKR